VPRRARPPLRWNIRPKSCEALICCGGGGRLRTNSIQFNSIRLGATEPPIDIGQDIRQCEEPTVSSPFLLYMALSPQYPPRRRGSSIEPHPANTILLQATENGSHIARQRAVRLERACRASGPAMSQTLCVKLLLMVRTFGSGSTKRRCVRGSGRRASALRTLTTGPQANLTT
jgi:hypothetical protein